MGICLPISSVRLQWLDQVQTHKESSYVVREKDLEKKAGEEDEKMDLLTDQV